MAFNICHLIFVAWYGYVTVGCVRAFFIFFVEKLLNYKERDWEKLSDIF